MDLRERLSLRFQARQLDRALAAGASAADSPQLARRAAALARADTRTQWPRHCAGSPRAMAASPSEAASRPSRRSAIRCEGTSNSWLPACSSPAR